MHKKEHLYHKTNRDALSLYKIFNIFVKISCLFFSFLQMIVLEKHVSFFLEYVLYFGGEETMANNSNKKLVPEAMNALDKFKYEVASEVGVNLKDGYNGDISARDAGKIGGNMVRKLIQQAENNMR